MFHQMFFSHLKRWTIIAYKHGTYQLPHELPNNLRLRMIRMLENNKNKLYHPLLQEEIEYCV